MVGLGLTFKISGLVVDHKIWQSAHLWPRALQHYGCNKWLPMCRWLESTVDCRL